MDICVCAAVATLTIDLQKVIVYAANKHVERPRLRLKTEASVLFSSAMLREAVRPQLMHPKRSNGGVCGSDCERSRPT